MRTVFGFCLLAAWVGMGIALVYRAVWAPQPAKSIVNLEASAAVVFFGYFCIFSFARDPGDTALAASQRWPVFLFALVAFTSVPFLVTLNTPFLHDSYAHIVRASHQSFGEALRAAYVHPQTGDFFFRPLGYLGYWLEFKTAGFSFLRWHLQGLLLHLAAMVLVFVLARMVRLSVWASFFAALVFGLHGSNPEVVSWVAARFDEWGTCFCLAALVLFLMSVRSGKGLGWMMAACVCAGLSKESAFCLPLLAMCVLAFTGDGAAKEWRRPLIALTGSCVLVFTYRAWVVQGVGGYRDTKGAPAVLHAHLLHVAEALFLRLWAVLLIPLNWSVRPEVWVSIGLFVLVMAGGCCLMFSCPFRRRVLAALGFSLCALLPAAHLGLIDARLTGARVFHLALIGFSLFVGALYDGFRNRKLAALAVCGICFFQACALLHNLLIWRETALLAAGTCSEFGRDAPQMETLTVLDLPSTWNGVYFLKNGFADCVLINSGRRLTISETSQPGGQAPVFRWNGVSETIVRER